MTSSDDSRMFLTDDPITSEEQDSFGHIEYVDTLSTVIQNVEPPWHVGIFGEWGSGKSSIIKLLYNRIRSRSEFDEVLCIEFDAWAHAEDSIRTELLLELDQAIGEEIDGEDSEGVLGEDDITGRLYDVEEDEQVTKSSSPQEIISDFWSDSPLLAIAFVGLAIAAVALEAGGYSAAASVVLTGLLLPVLGYILQQLDTVAQTIQRKFLYPRKEWTGAYQRIFESIIQESEAEKVVISVDNLDRCESDTVYDVLVSLKTFLEDDRCIYLIPCDDEALESHLKAINEDGYFGDTRSEREFLRKFFQTHMRIPPFQTEDVENYAQEQNEQLSNSFDEETVDIIANAYFENPRRIKNAINRLVTLRKIAEEREAEGILNSGRITENTPFLAKISILEEEFSDFYRQLVDDPYLLDDVNSYFNNDLQDEDKQDRIKKILDIDERGESRLESFLSSTQRVTAPNVRPFLNLAEPSYSSGLDDLDDVMRYLKTGQQSELREQIEDIRERSRSFAQYCDAIDDDLQTYRSNSREQPMYSIIRSLVSIFNVLEEEEKKQVAQVVGKYLVRNPVREDLPHLNAKSVFPILLVMPARYSRRLFNRFAELVKIEDGLNDGVLEAFITHADEIPRRTVSKFSTSVIDLRDDNLSAALKSLADSSEAKEHLVTAEIIEVAASLVEMEDNQNEYTKTGQYGQFDDIAGVDGRSSYVEKLLELRDDYNGNQADQIDQSLARELMEVGSKVSESTAEKVFQTIKELLEEKSNERVVLVEAVLHFHESFSENTWSEVQQLISDLYRKWNPNNVREIYEFAVENKIPVLESEEEVDAFLSRVPSHINNEDFIIDEVIPRVSSEYDSKIADKADGLIQNNNNNHRQLGLSIVEKHPSRFEEEWGSIIEQCGRQAKGENNSNVKKRLLMPIAKHFSKLDGPEQESFIGQMEILLRGNAGDYKVYKELWDAFSEDADADRRAAVVGDVREEVAQRLSNNQNPDHLTPIIEVLQSMPEELGKNQGGRFMERLSNALTDQNLNASQLKTVVEQIAGFKEFYGKEDQILDRLESLLDRTNNNAVKNAAKDLIQRFEQLETVDQERLEGIKEYYLE
ncbi:KAP family P-loop NTPase fold protein [Halobellus captivus]|uniref:KAP family P-loop NTPase fold protein n=1 Tax=Halobellus captivus TaxID=2592614 RepID=UPI00119CA3CF|nr:P-loop NTPase fold protein [Halobellus captivus]